MKKILLILAEIVIFQFIIVLNLYSQTEILKWKDGKSSCVSITYDDGSINQFKVAMPVMDRLGLPGTFYVNSGNFNGSKYYPTFAGRPIMEILKESETVPASQANLFERTSMVSYLRDVEKVPELSDYNISKYVSNIQRGQLEEVFNTLNEICIVLRKSNKVFNARPVQNKAIDNTTTWEDLVKYSEKGHEFACHTISHRQLSLLDKNNIIYELEMCREDIRDHLGFKHTLSVECPFGTHDERVLTIAEPYFYFSRNSCPEDYIDVILRGYKRMPSECDREYIQWQRGALSKTPYSLMTSWIDTSIQDNVWLVLVFHGIEGIGYEAVPGATIENYFSYIKENEDNVWVATFQDGYKYIRERMNTKIRESAKKGTITIELSNELDKKIYDIPLTLQTKVPDDWKVVQVRQGKSLKKIKSIAKDGSNWVIYNVVPDNTPVRLSKG